MSEVMLCPYGEISFEEKPKPKVKIRLWYKCPVCGTKLELAPNMRGMNISGSINLRCNKKVGKNKCKGVVKIKPKE